MAHPAEPHVMATYGRLPIALSHGRGCRVWDSEGREYLDALAGIAVNTLGHGHPKLVPALQDQVAKLIHTSNYYMAPLQEKLAAKLCQISGLANVFFGNSGLEANEGALKIARKYGHDRGIDKPEIIVYEKAFHGRSIATLSATGNSKVQAGFGPLVEGFVRVPLNDIAAIEEAARTRPNVVAVFLEVIQGEGGINGAALPHRVPSQDGSRLAHAGFRPAWVWRTRREPTSAAKAFDAVASATRRDLHRRRHPPASVGQLAGRRSSTESQRAVSRSEGPSWMRFLPRSVVETTTRGAKAADQPRSAISAAASTGNSGSEKRTTTSGRATATASRSSGA